MHINVYFRPMSAGATYIPHSFFLSLLTAIYYQKLLQKKRASFKTLTGTSKRDADHKGYAN